jgi:glucose-fructose oxidoreductase
LPSLLSVREQRVRYAVVGLGHIGQIAVLPAFAHARGNSELTALVSGDPDKLARLGEQYGVGGLYGYDRFEECLESGDVDAVYIALPNHLHRQYTIAAARKGIHVLCEKPMAVTEEECEEMIEAARSNGIWLMIAYRLHFEKANLKAIEIARSGRLGELRIFDSLFTMQVRDEDNIRLKREAGGGPLYDIGIYCINAARSLFRQEPVEVFAWSASRAERRFREVDEMTGVLMRFPEERLASLTASFGASDRGFYQIVGTKGDLRVDPAYEYAGELRHILTVEQKTRRRTFAKRDQFGPELVYFSDCVRKGREPEPSGREGLADVRVIRAALESARTGRPVRLGSLKGLERLDPEQEIHRFPIDEPELVGVDAPPED